MCKGKIVKGMELELSDRKELLICNMESMFVCFFSRAICMHPDRTWLLSSPPVICVYKLLTTPHFSVDCGAFQLVHRKVEWLVQSYPRPACKRWRPEMGPPTSRPPAASRASSRYSDLFSGLRPQESRCQRAIHQSPLLSTSCWYRVFCGPSISLFTTKVIGTCFADSSFPFVS